MSSPWQQSHYVSYHNFGNSRGRGCLLWNSWLPSLWLVLEVPLDSRENIRALELLHYIQILHVNLSFSLLITRTTKEQGMVLYRYMLYAICYRDVTIQGHPHTEVISKARYDEIILLWLICKPYGTETEFWICSFACPLFRALTTHKITTLTQN